MGLAPKYKGVVLAAALLAGEYAGFLLVRLAPAWPWALGIWVWLVLVCWGWRLRGFVPLLIFSWGILAAARVDAQRTALLTRHWLSGQGGETPHLTVLVEDEPQLHPFRRLGACYVFTTHRGPIPLRIVLPVTAVNVEPRRGESWYVKGWIARQTEQPHRFATRMLWARGGHRVTSVEKTKGLFSRQVAFFGGLSDRLAVRAGRGLGWCPTVAGLNRAILLGRRAELSQEIRETFVRAGTIHVFAISGLHVMLIALILSRAATAAGVSARFTGLVTAPLVLGYVLVTGARPSAVRAATMAIIYFAAPLVGRRGNLFSAWSMAMFFVYGLHPERVFDTGCILSFAVMFGIVLWLDWSAQTLPEKWTRGIWGTVGVSFAAWAASVPIAAHVFGRFTMGGLLANLAVLPLATLTVAFGMTGILLSFIAPHLAVVFNVLAAGTTEGMVLVSRLVAGLSASSVGVCPWPWSLCLDWYAALGGAFALAGWALNERQKKWWK